MSIRAGCDGGLPERGGAGHARAGRAFWPYPAAPSGPTVAAPAGR